MKEISINQSNWLYRYATWLRKKTDCDEPIETICDLTSTVVFRTIGIIFTIFFGIIAIVMLTAAFTSLVWGWFVPGVEGLMVAGAGLWAVAIYSYIKFSDSKNSRLVFEMYRNFKDKTCVKLNIVKE